MKRRKNHKRLFCAATRRPCLAVLRRGVCIDIRNRSRKAVPPDGTIRRVVGRVLAAEGVRNAHLSIQFVDDGFIEKLNRLFKGASRPTDVLSFDLSGQGTADFVFADVVVSVQTAHRTAARLDINPAQEILRYVIHGLLHLLGYDDLTPRTRRKMWRRQEELVRGLSSQR
ncbi:rRNA maturation RNase YbeY [Candidatus Velamenicoccus archaeovorus]|uniref:rRNA maturation RNase YbeY n=1 Tax=Velamenicoccus archaeovorus TaxID=1930593 RepID=UPI0013E8C992|nr:rRNA maturation RNase YbeY [Candidatus Velamenicoccus archaeovorus]